MMYLEIFAVLLFFAIVSNIFANGFISKQVTKGFVPAVNKDSLVYFGTLFVACCICNNIQNNSFQPIGALINTVVIYAVFYFLKKKNITS